MPGDPKHMPGYSGQPDDALFNQLEGLDGLAMLRAWIAGDVQPPMGRTIGINLVKAEWGRAVFEGTPGPGVYNPLGTVHGGFAATLLDSACGCAVHSMLSASQSYTTLELKVAYHRPLNVESGLVTATGQALSVGRRAAFAEAKLTDSVGRLCASATSTLLVFERPSGKASNLR